MFSQYITVPKLGPEVCISLEDTERAVARVIDVLLSGMPQPEKDKVTADFERYLDRTSECRGYYTVEERRFFVGMRVEDAHLFVNAYEDTPQHSPTERPISQWPICVPGLEALATYEGFETRFYLQEEKPESGRYPLRLLPVVEALRADLTDMAGLYRTAKSSRPLDRCFGRAARKMQVKQSTKAEWSCITGKASGLDVRLWGVSAWVQGYQFELAKREPQGVYVPMGQHFGAPYISLEVKSDGFRPFNTARALSVATALGQTVCSTIASQ
jgi:hypothetical protein